MRNGRETGRGREREGGFALVLAILSLMLLTFLGLTLATTTSTELQIATNYRWSQMALYNAEAGLEAARIVLSDAADEADGWQSLIPQARPGVWDYGSAPGPADTICSDCRDFENMGCDAAAGIGYGLVLDDGITRLEDISTFMGHTLNGAFTVWVRRGTDVNDKAEFSDSTDDNQLVIVSQGVAPFIGASTAFTRARQAVRILETRYALVAATPNDPCESTANQEGANQSGDNFNACALITSDALAGAFGGGGGTLTDTGNR